jgi:glycine cleavage system H protein
MNRKSSQLKYTKEHEWIKVEGNLATVGITHYAQEKLADIVFVELPKIGKILKQGETLAVLESVKAVSDVFSPVSGEVTEVNETLVDKPELINQKPYSKGWIARLRAKDLKELDDLMTAREYEEFSEKEKQ